jgi:hypothetical protein
VTSSDRDLYDSDDQVIDAGGDDDRSGLGGASVSGDEWIALRGPRHAPVRHWVLTVPFGIWFGMAFDPLSPASGSSRPTRPAIRGAPQVLTVPGLSQSSIFCMTCQVAVS